MSAIRRNRSWRVASARSGRVIPMLFLKAMPSFAHDALGIHGVDESLNGSFQQITLGEFDHGFSNTSQVALGPPTDAFAY